MKAHPVQPDRATARPVETVLLDHSRATVAQRATDDFGRDVGEVVVADRSPNPVVTDLHSALHGTAAVGQAQLEWSLDNDFVQYTIIVVFIN